MVASASSTSAVEISKSSYCLLMSISSTAAGSALVVTEWRVLLGSFLVHFDALFPFIFLSHLNGRVRILVQQPVCNTLQRDDPSSLVVVVVLRTSGLSLTEILTTTAARTPFIPPK